jgi:CheY-like chemotaxis protein
VPNDKRPKPNARVRVLLVDDDRALLETTVALLEEEFAVFAAGGGLEARQVLERHPIDVVCSDYSMPDVDGISLLRRARESYPRIEGVLVTAIRDQLPRGFANDESVFAVVYKPYAPEALISAIRAAANVARMRTSVARLGLATQRLTRMQKGDR